MTLADFPWVKDPSGVAELACYELLENFRSGKMTADQVVDVLMRLFGAAMTTGVTK